MGRFRSVGGLKKYYKYNECEKGQLLVEGVFIGTSPNKFGKENFDFRPSEGPVVSLNHAGHLAWIVENHVPVGAEVQVYYEGKEMLDKGQFAGKEVHKFDVKVNEDEAQQLPLGVPEPIKQTETPVTKNSVDLSDLD